MLSFLLLGLCGGLRVIYHNCVCGFVFVWGFFFFLFFFFIVFVCLFYFGCAYFTGFYMTINYIFMLLDFALWLWLEFASVVIELFYKKEQEQP